MFGAMLILPTIVLLLCLVVAAVLWTIRDRNSAASRDLHARFPKLANLRADIVRVRLIAFGAGLILAGATSYLGNLGLGLALAPAVLALTMIFGQRLLELKHAKAASEQRAASLVTRSAGDYLRPVVGAIAALAFISFAWVIIGGEIFGSPDDAGLNRSLSLQCGDYSSSNGPYPGTFYTRPMLISAIVLIAVAAWAIMTIVRRPRDARPEVIGVDDSLRVESTQGIISALTIGLGLQAFGASLFAVNAFAQLSGPGHMCQVPTTYDISHWLYVSAMAAALVVVVVSATRYFYPTAATRYLGTTSVAS